MYRFSASLPPLYFTVSILQPLLFRNHLFLWRPPFFFQKKGGPYANADSEKIQILTDNKDKAGVYRWTNLKNGKTYIGSSINIFSRLITYYNINYLLKNNMTIYRSILKYGYSNFSFEILEYCDPEKAIEREQHFLDMLKPQYNILKKAGSSLGFKHSFEDIEKMKNRIWTPEHKEKRSEHLKRIHGSPEYKAKILEGLNRLNADTDFQEKRLEHLKRLHENDELQAKRLKNVKEKTGRSV
jgi:group I intron endonuclease